MRYRLDERVRLRSLSKNSHIWLERIEFVEDEDDDDYPIFYTEDYRQVSLVKLLKFCYSKQTA